MHPMTLSDILDGAFKLFKANARTVVLVTAAFIVPLDLVAAFLARHASVNLGGIVGGNSGEANVDVPAVAYVLSLVRYFVIVPVVGAAVTLVVAESYLGRAVDGGTALRAAGRRAVAVVWASWIVFACTAVGFSFLVVPGLAFLGLFAGVVPAIVVEGLGPGQAIRRSWRLFRPRMFRTAGILLLALLMALVLLYVLGGIPAVIASAIGSAGWPLRAAGNVAVALVAAPFLAIVGTLLYFDGRIRQEGFDLQLMAEDLSRRRRS
jgi:hypothetical protein